MHFSETMKSLSTIGLGFVFSFILGGCKTDHANNDMQLNNEIDSVSYSLGLSVAQNAKDQGFEELNSAALTKAFDDVFEECTPAIDLSQATIRLRDYYQKRFAVKIEEDKKAEKEFLNKNKRKTGVITLPSGLQYKVITQRAGEIPSYFDIVTAHYQGTTPDGKVIESSLATGEPSTFAVKGVIKGLQEALQLMPEGSKWQLFIPSDLAYGPKGSSKVEPNTTLFFEVELLSIY